jgi:outer membrane protein OmpA-like peptidoglycan-associated protein
MLEGNRNASSRDLLGLVKQQVTPQAIQAVAAQLGEDRERTASAVSTSVPSVLAALSDVAETDRGAEHLRAAIEAKASPASRSATMSLLEGGTGRDDALLDEELGRRSWAISDGVARATGIGRESAHKLLGGVTSVALLAIAKTGTPTDPTALRALLHRESTRGETMYTAPEHAGPAIRRLESPRRSWWLLGAALALLAIIAIPLARGVMRNRQASIAPPTPTPTEPAKPQVTAPAPEATPPQAAAPAPAPAPTEPPAGTTAEEPQAAAPADQPTEPQAAAPAEEPQAAAPTETPTPAEEPAEGPSLAPDSSVSELASFLGSEERTTPRTFMLEPLNFATGSSEPTSESVSTIDDLAETLRFYPSAEITLDSHTDSKGSASANEALADARSESVKEMLVGRGVDESRITTAGHGQNAPVDTNATSQGRAANRRTDVTVTSK